MTDKEELFINAYLGEARFNATRAMRIAGYKGNDNVLAVSGHRLLRKPKIVELVRERINEAAMSANEVLSRLSDVARGRLADCLDEDGRFDLKLAKERGIDQLLKKLKVKRTSKRVGLVENGDKENSEVLETSLLYEEVEFEMYSALDALRDLGRYHKLFAERVEHSNPDGSPLLQPVAEAIVKVYGTAKS